VDDTNVKHWNALGIWIFCISAGQMSVACMCVVFTTIKKKFKLSSVDIPVTIFHT